MNRTSLAVAALVLLAMPSGLAQHALGDVPDPAKVVQSALSPPATASSQPVFYAFQEDFEDPYTPWENTGAVDNDPSLSMWSRTSLHPVSPTHDLNRGRNGGLPTGTSGTGAYTATFLVPNQAVLTFYSNYNAPLSYWNHIDINIIRNHDHGTYQPVWSSTTSEATTKSMALPATPGESIQLEFIHFGNGYWSIDDVAVTGSGAPNAPGSPTIQCGSPNGISISWTAPAFDGGTPITSYQIYRSADGTTYSSVASTLQTSYTDLPPWATSAYYYKVTAVNANAESVASSVVSRAPCDSQPPTLSGTATTYPWTTACGTSVSGWTAQDTYSGLASVEYSLVNQGAGRSYSGAFGSLDGFTVGQTTPFNAGGNFCGWNGINVLKLRTTDRAGSVVGWTDAYTIRMDQLAPTVTGAPAPVGWTNFNPTLGTVCFLDPHSGLAAGSARYWVGSTPGGIEYQAATLLSSQPANGKTDSWCPSFQVSTGTLHQGTNYVTIEVKDILSHTTTANAYVIQYDTQGDTVAGLVARTGAGGSLIPMNVWQNDNTPRFEWNPASSTSPITGYSYVLDGNGATSPDATTETSNTFYAPAFVPEGTSYFRVRSVDSAGNAGTATSAFGIKVDTGLPGAPTLASSTHPNSALYYNVATATFQWTATDSLSGVDGYSYDLVAGTPGGIPDTVKDAEETTTSIGFTPGAFGTWTFRVRAVDNAGNWGPTTLKVIHLDTVKPIFTDHGPTGTLAQPTDIISVSFNDLDGGLDSASTPATRIDVSKIDFWVDGQNVIAMYSQLCPPTGTLCYLRVTESGIQYKPLRPWEDGPHTVSVHVQDTAAGAANGNDLNWGFTVNSGGAADQDGDRIPDEVEGEICGRSATALVVSGSGFLGHRCASLTDYAPPSTGGTYLVPRGYTIGPDADGDGFPSVIIVQKYELTVSPFSLSVVQVAMGPDQVVQVDTQDNNPNYPVLSQTTVGPVLVGLTPGPDNDNDGVPGTVFTGSVSLVIDRTSPTPVSVVPGNTEPHTVDSNDADPNVPVQSVLTLPIAVPSGLSFGPDNDRDGVPQWAAVRMSYVTVDRRNSDPFSFQDGNPVTETLDTQDSNPNSPVPVTQQTLSVPTSIAYSDDDGDGVPGTVWITWFDVSVDRTQPSPVTTGGHQDTRTVDSNDGNRNAPVPYNVFDADGDGVPDATELAVCLVEDQRTPTDGTCNGNDYHPPTL